VILHLFSIPRSQFLNSAFFILQLLHALVGQLTVLTPKAPLHRASTTVTFPVARPAASIGLGNPGLLGMPPNRSKIRRGKPQVGGGLRESFARPETAHSYLLSFVLITADCPTLRGAKRTDPVVTAEST
jgi:hypothetical protein